MDPTEPLSDALSRLRVTASIAAVATLHEPWGIALPTTGWRALLVVAEGRCWLTGPDLPDQELEAGDVLLVNPRAAPGLALRRPRAAPAIDAARLFGRWGEAGEVIGGHGGDPCVLIIAAFAIAPSPAEDLLAGVPAALRLPAAEAGAAIPAAAALVTAERRVAGLGSPAVLNRLSEVLLVYALRQWARSPRAGAGGWLSALADPALSAALAALHADPAADWTVPELARRAHLSRSHFARRFTAAVGAPPAAYLARWRMVVAGRLLEETDRTVDDVAAGVGYRSTPAFTRAFTRAVGTTPAAHRRAARHANPPRPHGRQVTAPPA